MLIITHEVRLRKHNLENVIAMNASTCRPAKTVSCVSVTDLKWPFNRENCQKPNKARSPA